MTNKSEEKVIINNTIENIIEYLENIANGVRYAGTDRRLSIAVAKVIELGRQETRKELIEEIKKMIDKEYIHSNCTEVMKNNLKRQLQELRGMKEK